jgi:predicted RecB family nuclease
MRRAEGTITLSASDLVGHLNCKCLTCLNIDLLNGILERPRLWDPLLQILRERGARHEQGFLGHLQSQGFELTMMEGIGVDSEAVARTRDAMLGGGQVIVQGALQENRCVGRADVLQRVEMPSDLGPWSYEVIDTKLARATKGGTVLQLCLYADLVKSVQGRLPESCYVVAPWSNYQPQAYRMDDYSALYGRVRRNLEEYLEAPNHGEVYPEPKDFCDVCGWRAHCKERRRADDHLCLVAGISKLQRNELQQQAIKTVAELAAMPLPLAWKPERGSAHSYQRVREQARIQVEGRKAGRVLYELLPLEPSFGLSILPEPSAGDVFFDLEGDPFAGEGGLEYLFGYAYRGPDEHLAYSGDWVLSRSDEKKAFERFMDFVAARLRQYPDLHIYHFAPYEPAALKRLMGRHATREEALDQLLRGKVFVDLYSVVRHALRASVESYSIKRLEPVYGFARAISLPDANIALAKVEACLEFEDLDSIQSEDRATVEAYNRDDCLSTLALRDWLEEQRAHLVAQGVEINRPTVQTGDASEALSAWQERINDVADERGRSPLILAASKGRLEICRILLEAGAE